MATKSQRTVLRVSTATAAADNITAITAASPPVVTAGTHGITEDSIVTIASVGGMVEVNNRAFVFDNITSTTGELKGIDASGYTAYTSGGTVIAHTMTKVGELRDIAGFDGEAPDVDSTHLESLAEETEPGLQSFGQVTFALNLVTDTGQARLRALKESGTITAFSATLSDGRVAAFRAWVKSFSFSAPGPNSIVTGSVTLRVTNAPAFFA